MLYKRHYSYELLELYTCSITSGMSKSTIMSKTQGIYSSIFSLSPANRPLKNDDRRGEVIILDRSQSQFDLYLRNCESHSQD